MIEIAGLGVLFLVLVAISALAVWSLRDVVVLYFEDKYGIKIEKEDDEKIVDTDC